METRKFVINSLEDVEPVANEISEYIESKGYMPVELHGVEKVLDHLGFISALFKDMRNHAEEITGPMPSHVYSTIAGWIDEAIEYIKGEQNE